MIGVFVNSKRVPYARLIANGTKWFETRTRNTLRALAGKRVAIIETGKKHTNIIGFATIGEPHFITDKREWNLLRCWTCIPVGDKFDNIENGKWIYRMIDAEETTPYPLPSNAIRHGRVWCEFDI